MDIYNLGPDDLESRHFPRGLVWAVCWYERYEYAGIGEAVALASDESLRVYGLNHISCWHLADEKPHKVSQEEYLREPDSVHDPEYNKEVMAKVKELLGKSEP